MEVQHIHPALFPSALVVLQRSLPHLVVVQRDRAVGVCAGQRLDRDGRRQGQHRLGADGGVDGTDDQAAGSESDCWAQVDSDFLAQRMFLQKKKPGCSQATIPVRNPATGTAALGGRLDALVQVNYTMPEEKRKTDSFSFSTSSPSSPCRSRPGAAGSRR